MLRLPIIAALLATSSAVSARGAAADLAAIQAPARIGPCVNMANHLEAPREGAWGRRIADRDFDAIAAAGFRTVRLPVRWSAHAAAATPYVIDRKFLNRVTHVVARARKAGLRVILDMHNYDELYEKPAAHAARFAGLWRAIAAHFRDADPELWFELINEPHAKLTDANLMAVLAPALAAVRETNPTRTVVIGGRDWSNIDSLATVPMPKDGNLVATFHYYEPFAFTHQGASWVDPVPALGPRYPQPGDAERLARDVAKARSFIEERRIPVFMGEYGAYEKASAPDRVRYYRAVRDAFSKAGVDGCVWGYTNSFPFRVGDRWDAALLGAIGLGK